MDCEYKINQNELRIILPRELDHHIAAQIQEETDLLVSSYPIDRIVFDFRSTHFMDSSGIGVILGRYRSIHFSGGKILAENTNPRVRRILLMSGLETIINTKG